MAELLGNRSNHSRAAAWERIGRFLLHRFYGGEEDRFRSRSNDKETSLRKLLAYCKDRGLKLSMGYLHAAVNLYLQKRDLEDRCPVYAELGVTQRRELLPLQRIEDKVELADRCMSRRWNTRLLKQAVRARKRLRDREESTAQDPAVVERITASRQEVQRCRTSAAELEQRLPALKDLDKLASLVEAGVGDEVDGAAAELVERLSRAGRQARTLRERIQALADRLVEIRAEAVNLALPVDGPDPPETGSVAPVVSGLDTHQAGRKQTCGVEKEEEKEEKEEEKEEKEEEEEKEDDPCARA
jgi:hypothetical protein